MIKGQEDREDKDHESFVYLSLLIDKIVYKRPLVR